jgi:hypothetical protein
MRTEERLNLGSRWSPGLVKHHARTEYRILEVRSGKVACLPGREETIEHCRFCVSSRSFRIKGRDVPSPALAFCVRNRSCDEVNLREVEAVACADHGNEGYRSMMNIIA